METTQQIFPIAQKDAQIACVHDELKHVEFDLGKKDDLYKQIIKLKKERLELNAITSYVRFFVDVVLRPTFLIDLVIFEKCLIRFKKDRLYELRKERDIKKERLVEIDRQIKIQKVKWDQQKSNELSKSINQLKSEMQTLIKQGKQLDNEIDMLDLTVDKFCDEIFSTYDWIIEKEKRNSPFLEPELKIEVENFKSQIDIRLDRCIKLIEHGFSVHILRGKPLKIESQALRKVFEKLKSTEELLIITVIGEQSSAKSSLLNAIFGCDFRTSAGRCTVGMYMNFVKYKVWLI